MTDVTMPGRQAVLGLFDALLHMAYFGTRDYRKLDLGQRKEFADLMRTGDLGFVFERLKVVATYRKVKLPPDVLAETAGTLFNKPVTEAKRKRARVLALSLVGLPKKRGRPRSEAVAMATAMSEAMNGEPEKWNQIRAAVRAKLGDDYEPDSLPRMVRRAKRTTPRT